MVSIGNEIVTLLDWEHGTFDAVGPCEESLVLAEMVAEAFRAQGGLY